MTRLKLLGQSALVLSLWGVALPATAQVLEPDEEEEASVARPGEAVGPGIIVTAQKRDESLQPVLRHPSPAAHRRSGGRL